MLIYEVICNVNSRVYIGQTCKTLSIRQSQHLAHVKSGSRYAFHNAIRKYGSQNFTWRIVRDNLTKIEADVLEIDLISKSHKPYNMTMGGGGKLGWRHSESTKLKMSLSKIGKFIGRPSNKKGTKLDQTIKDKIAISSGGGAFQVFKDNILIGVWFNQARCAQDLNLNQTHISKCLLGKRRTHRGYSFQV